MKCCQSIILLVVTAVITAGCTSDSERTEAADLEIYTSLYPIQYAAEKIGGETGDVQSVYPPGADAKCPKT